MSMDGHRTKRRRKIAENFNRLSRAHERYRRAMTSSEREREFTFANKTYCQLPFAAPVSTTNGTDLAKRMSIAIMPTKCTQAILMH